MATPLSCLLLLASHPRPGSDFCAFKPVWEQQAKVTYIACNQAADKAKSQGIESIDLLKGKKIEQLSDQENEQLLDLLREQLRNCSTLIVDVGEQISERALLLAKREMPSVKRIVYYDNPEPFVPGAYSQTAAKVCPLAQKILFANAKLQPQMLLDGYQKPIFTAKDSMPFAGIGYYPMQDIEQLRTLRRNSQARAQLLQSLGHKDQGQKILVYAGGANDPYFEQAWPEFLNMLRELKKSRDLSSWIIVLQQHPRAKQEGKDSKMLEQLAAELKVNAHTSTVNFNQAFSAADVALYYQTTSNIQFFLSGIPTIQVSAEPYNDQLVREGLVPVATNAEQLHSLITNSKPMSQQDTSHYEKALGIEQQWQENLKQSL